MSYQETQAAAENYNKVAAATMYAQQVAHAQAQAHRNGQAQAAGYPASTASSTDNGMNNLVGAFAQTHLNVPNNNVQQAAGAMPAVNAGAPQYFYMDGQIVYMPQGNVFQQPMGEAQLPDGSYTYPVYAPQAAYPGYMSGYSVMPYAQQRQNYRGDRRENDQRRSVPGLDNGRKSYSSSESAPGTPFYVPIYPTPSTGAEFGSHYGTIIVGTDGSPSYSTPSPGPGLGVSLHNVRPLPYKNSAHSVDIDALLAQDPAIPPAVPAVFTPRENMRTLEQSLSNPIYGNRNVYIRGLHPDTNDETLALYAARFGTVETSKAIIDTSTGACKGFGFAKYFEVRDSELCIRGFYKLGYEVGFARESFNSRLKAKGDQSSTNLYVSNLPKEMNEAELAAIFMDYTVVSSRILHDSQGNSRGVGFARFETREICEEIIKNFHGTPIGDEGLLLQVRYADTPAQKDLKKITTERRQFRTTEYNVSAYGSPVELISLSPQVGSPGPGAGVNRMAQVSRHLPQVRIAGSWKRDGSMSGSVTYVSSRSCYILLLTHLQLRQRAHRLWTCLQGHRHQD